MFFLTYMTLDDLEPTEEIRNLASALQITRRLAYSDALGARPGVHHEVILITSGPPQYRLQEAKDEALRYDPTGLHLSIVGVGAAANSGALRDMASSNSVFYPVPYISTLPSVSGAIGDVISKRSARICPTPDPSSKSQTAQNVFIHYIFFIAET